MIGLGLLGNRPSFVCFSLFGDHELNAWVTGVLFYLGFSLLLDFCTDVRPNSAPESPVLSSGYGTL